MRRTIFICVWLLAAAAAGRAKAIPPAQQSGRVVDRIVARVEGDIILQSQVRELGAFQQLIEGRAESDDQLLSELIEQWVVQTEAASSRFPEPAQSEVDRELARLTSNFAGPAAYSVKLNELGLSATQVRQLLVRQIYVERYLDYKFRPSVLIESADIDSYYQKELLPELAKKNQPAPARSEVEEQIRELLIQRGISDLTTKWLDETKSRLKIELTPGGAKS
jgi:parvulin-like peptidyl-prolyl isomerase